MKALLIATHNLHKKEEYQQLLGSDFEVKSLADYHLYDEIIEDGNSFQANALIKAKYCFEKTGLPSIGDDSGLVIPALDGRPGIYSARYAGEEKDFVTNMDKVLYEMKNVEDRRAYFITVLCMIDARGIDHYFEGRVYGNITHQKQGEKGFGYDPIFIPDGHNLTFGEFSVEQKNAISHRRIALDQLLDFLN